MSEAKVLHEWKAESHYEYRLVATNDGAVLLERFPAEDPRWTTGYGAGNDVGNEIARLASRLRDLEAAVRWVAHTVPRPDRKLDPVYQEAKFRMHVWLADHPIVREVLEVDK